MPVSPGCYALPLGVQCLDILEAGVRRLVDIVESKEVVHPGLLPVGLTHEISFDQASGASHRPGQPLRSQTGF